jgi:signal transduction histidine kinase
MSASGKTGWGTPGGGSGGGGSGWSVKRLTGLSPLALGAALATALVGVGLSLEFAAGAVDPGALGIRGPVLLVALGALCVVGLTIRRKPSIAWIAASFAAGLATVEIVSLARAISEPAIVAAPGDGVPTGDGGPALLVLAAVARLTTVAIAFSYAFIRPATNSRRGEWVRIGLIGVAIWVVAVEVLAAVAALDAAGANPFSVWPERFANRATFIATSLAVLAGVVMDLLEPVRAARRRLDAEGAEQAGSTAAGPAGGLDRAARFVDLVVDELLPERRAARRRIVEGERARLASDLHAAVLPELRSALASARGAGASDTAGVGRHLESAVGSVEDLMAMREPVIIEAFGLLPAIEWLAERTQLRGKLEVRLDIAGASVGAQPGRPPLAVERAAFRVAQLALDNVVRHAQAKTATVSFASGADHLEVSIADDGHGIDLERPTDGRGLRDMRQEADAVSASLTVTGGTGTRVDFAWRARTTA